MLPTQGEEASMGDTQNAVVPCDGLVDRPLGLPRGISPLVSLPSNHGGSPSETPTSPPRTKGDSKKVCLCRF